jgi:enoyl-CoA hydratase
MALVRTETADGVAVVTLNDPGRRNVLSLDMNAELIAAMDEIEADPSTRAVIVTGAPPAFSAGGNLDDLLAKRHAEGLRQIYAGFLRVAACPLPTIAAVNGPAVGAGLNFALACDVILAGRSARFDSRFLQIAIHPGGGHTWRLRSITDLQTVKAFLLFGEVLSGEDAERVGLAWRCYDDDALLAGAHALAGRAARVPRELLERTKATIVATGGIHDADDAVELELGPQAWSMQQPEFVAMTSAMKARISKG